MAAEARRIATNKRFEAVVIQTDVTSEESVVSMVEAAVRAFGRIDYASNIAGVSCIYNMLFLIEVGKANIIGRAETGKKIPSYPGCR